MAANAILQNPAQNFLTKNPQFFPEENRPLQILESFNFCVSA